MNMTPFESCAHLRMRDGMFPSIVDSSSSLSDHKRAWRRAGDIFGATGTRGRVEGPADGERVGNRGPER